MKKRKDFGRYCNFDTVEAPLALASQYQRELCVPEVESQEECNVVV